jgi:magnesium transporter
VITFYGLSEGGLDRLAPDPANRSKVIWIDLFEPNQEEDRVAEAFIGAEIPTATEMKDIEESARLYMDGGVAVMTAVIINGVDKGRPNKTQVTFVLTGEHLVTVRYADPLPFRSFEAKCARQPKAHTTADLILLSLLESIVERIADVMETIASDLFAVSTKVFLDEEVPRRPIEATDALQELIRKLGTKNLTIGILRESLLSLSRLLPFFRVSANSRIGKEGAARAKQIERDLRSLADYETQLSTEITFLHSATLGLINL